MPIKSLQNLSIILMVIFLHSCSKGTPSASQMEKSPFTGSPCSAPCWQNLFINRSTESDVKEVLQTLTFINKNTIDSHEISMPSTTDPQVYVPSIEITADCIYPKSQCLTLRIVNDLLNEIEIILNYEISLAKAIDYLGNPDFIGFEDLSTEKISCVINIVWKEKQIILSSTVFNGSAGYDRNCGVVQNTGKAEANLIISEVKYLSSKALEVLLSSDDNLFFKFSETTPSK